MMKVLLTGATGYIGRRLLPVLLQEGCTVVCCVRDKSRFDTRKYPAEQIQVIEADFLKKETLKNIPQDIEAAYYLLHSMAAKYDDFQKMEETSAIHFKEAIEKTAARQVIYLSGIINEDDLSKHLSSRKQVEDILASASFNLTVLRAGIIVGSGSASFEIIRDLVEKLPVMIAPRWLNTKSQPIAIRNVIEFLKGVLFKKDSFGINYDIGGPDVMTYQDMLMQYAEIRHLKRKIFTVPVMTPRLSSYWLYFVTSTSYALAGNLVDSMKVNIICRPNNLAEKLGITLLTYKEAIQRAFDKVEQNLVISSWKDAYNTSVLNQNISQFMEVPVYGCFKDKRVRRTAHPGKTLNKLWSIGGSNGWYFANWLWEIRGFLDQIAGGVGLRRGRKNQDEISAGEALDFWRVLAADREAKRLLLFAEMRLPGEAWLEFHIDETDMLHQTATFRPRGLLGRLYWFAVWPFHGVVFGGMLRNLVKPY